MGENGLSENVGRKTADCTSVIERN